MTIIYSNRELEHPPFTDLGKVECSYCDYPLTFPCVFWMTAKGKGLYSHPACTHQWIVGLIKDVHKIDAMRTAREEVA